LVPFTWRLETLVTSVTVDSGPVMASALDRLLFYPRAIWTGWLPGSARWMVLALLCGTAMAAVRSPAVRGRLLALGTVAGIELFALTFLAGRNLQPRRAVDLAPLLALAAVLWVPALPRPALRQVLGGVAAVALLASVLPGWRAPELAGTLGRGFESLENGD